MLTLYIGVIKLVAFSLGKRIWCFSLAFSPCGVQGKLKFLLSFGFTVSLRFYFVYTHCWNSPCIFSIRRKFKICKLILIYFKYEFEFPYILVLLSFTPHFFCVPCSSIRENISSEMVCKSTNMYDRVNKYTAKYLLIMNGPFKSKRLCRSTFCERDMLSSCDKHKPDAWWLVMFFVYF